MFLWKEERAMVRLQSYPKRVVIANLTLGERGAKPFHLTGVAGFHTLHLAHGINKLAIGCLNLQLVLSKINESSLIG